jgi:hypothetical protein
MRCNLEPDFLLSSACDIIIGWNFMPNCVQYYTCDVDVLGSGAALMLVLLLDSFFTS